MQFTFHSKDTWSQFTVHSEGRQSQIEFNRLLFTHISQVTIDDWAKNDKTFLALDDFPSKKRQKALLSTFQRRICLLRCVRSAILTFESWPCKVSTQIATKLWARDFSVHFFSSTKAQRGVNLGEKLDPKVGPPEWPIRQVKCLSREMIYIFHFDLLACKYLCLNSNWVILFYGSSYSLVVPNEFGGYLNNLRIWFNHIAFTHVHRSKRKWIAKWRQKEIKKKLAICFLLKDDLIN